MSAALALGKIAIFLANRKNETMFTPPPRIVISILFLISFIIRFFLADYEKILIFYPDELRYYHIAENIARGHFLVIYNLPTDFQKILYSLFLSPIFLFESRELQMHLIAALNAFLVSSVVFPSYLISKLFFENKKKILILCIFSLILSDLSFSVTLMSEILFLPLGLWAFYFFIKLILENHLNIILSATCGVLAYALYLCKEVGVLLLAAFCVFIVFAKILRLNIDFKAQIKNAAIACFLFLSVFLLFKLTIFYGLGNSYSQAQTTPGVLSKEGRIPFLFYGFYYYLMNVLLAGCFFLFTLPIIYFKNLKEKSKQLFVFVLSIILLTAFIVAYSITIREDFFSDFPHTHLRYLPYIWLPMLVVFFSLFEIPLKTITIKDKLFLIILASAFVLTYRGLSPMGAHAMLGFLRWTFMRPHLPFYEIQKIAFMLFIFYCMGNVLNKHTKKFLLCFLIFFALAQVFNTLYFSLGYRKNFELTDTQRQEIKILDNFIKENKDKTFLMVGYDFPRGQRTMDAFFNYPHIKTIDIKNLKSGDIKNFHPRPFIGSASHFNYSFEKIDYFVFTDSINIQFKQNATKDEKRSGTLWNVFKNENNKNIPEFSYSTNKIIYGKY